MLLLLLVMLGTAQAAWPRVALQTWNGKYLPVKIGRNFRQYGKGWERRKYTDAEAVPFLRTHFGENTADAFQKTAYGAHRADMLRYALLYVTGGFYYDMDVELLVPLDYVRHLAGDGIIVARTATDGRAFNAILGAPPGLPIFKTMVGYMTEHIDQNYFSNLDHLTRLLSSASNGFAGEGSVFYEGTPLLIVSEEFRDERECWDGRDFYSRCSFITLKNEKLFKTRYSDFFTFDHPQYNESDAAAGVV